MAEARVWIAVMLEYPLWMVLTGTIDRVASERLDGACLKM